MFRSVMLAFLLLMCCFIVKAQEMLEGRVLELGSNVPLANIRVNNVSSGRSTISDVQGKFKLPAKKGDLIALSLYSYHPDTVFLTELRPRDFFMQPISNELKEVAIKGVYTRLGTMVDTTLQNVTYQRNPDGTLKGGLVFRLSYWNKDSKRERRIQAKLKEYEIQEEIDRVFSALFISKYTPLRGTELADFRSLYRPSVRVYKSSDFNLLLYLNDSYKEFKSLPPEKKNLPPLPPFNPR